MNNQVLNSHRIGIAQNRAEQHAKMLMAQKVITPNQYQETYDLLRNAGDYDEALYLGMIQLYYRKLRSSPVQGNAFNTLQSFINNQTKLPKSKTSIATIMVAKENKMRNRC